MNELKKFSNLLRINKIYKRKYFSAKLSNKVKPLLVILIKLNIINFVKIQTGNFYIIFPNLENKLKLVPMNKKSNQFISYNDIEKIILKKKWTAIISTSKGLKTSKECIIERLGGILLYNIICGD